MIFFVVATAEEATPIIDRYRLKKIQTFGQFRIYEDNGYTLIVSGIGKISSACATATVLSKYANSESIIFNIGVCGSNKLDHNISSLLLVNKSIDIASKDEFYGKIPFTHNINEIEIHTSDFPILNNEIKDIVVDMESFGFFRSASKFLQKERVFSLKIVSDNMGSSVVDKILIQEVIKNNLDKIEEFIVRTVSFFSSKVEQSHQEFGTLEMLSKKISNQKLTQIKTENIIKKEDEQKFKNYAKNIYIKPKLS